VSQDDSSIQHKVILEGEISNPIEKKITGISTTTERNRHFINRCPSEMRPDPFFSTRGF